MDSILLCGAEFSKENLGKEICCSGGPRQEGDFRLIIYLEMLFHIQAMRFDSVRY